MKEFCVVIAGKVIGGRPIQMRECHGRPLTLEMKSATGKDYQGQGCNSWPKLKKNANCERKLKIFTNFIEFR
jgi:hypothetical protein